MQPLEAQEGEWCQTRASVPYQAPCPSCHRDARWSSLLVDGVRSQRPIRSFVTSHIECPHCDKENQ